MHRVVIFSSMLDCSGAATRNKITWKRRIHPSVYSLRQKKKEKKIVFCVRLDLMLNLYTRWDKKSQLGGVMSLTWERYRCPLWHHKVQSYLLWAGRWKKDGLFRFQRSSRISIKWILLYPLLWIRRRGFLIPLAPTSTLWALAFFNFRPLATNAERQRREARWRWVSPWWLCFRRLLPSGVSSVCRKTYWVE